jgi:hypothetical protein
MTFLHRTSTEHLLSDPSTITNIEEVENARRELSDVTDRIRLREVKPSRQTRDQLARVASKALTYPDLPFFESVLSAGEILANVPVKYQTPELREAMMSIIQEQAPEIYSADEVAVLCRAIDITNQKHPFPQALEDAHVEYGHLPTELVIDLAESRMVTQANKNDSILTTQTTGAHKFNPFEDD